jgi:hypothetical protein
MRGGNLSEVEQQQQRHTAIQPTHALQPQFAVKPHLPPNMRQL